MRRIPVILMVAAMAAAFSATAQADADYARPGWYVGAGASWALFSELTNSIEDSPSDPPDSVIDADVDNPFGFTARGGYRIFSHFGSELQFEYLPYVGVKARDTEIADSKHQDISEFDFWTLTANAKAYVSDGRVQPFGLLGLGMGYARVKGLVDAAGTDSDVAFALRFGGGIDGYVTENVALTFDVSYVLPFQDLKNFDYLSLILGVKYRF